jgi:hypothetical protein
MLKSKRDESIRREFEAQITQHRCPSPGGKPMNRVTSFAVKSFVAVLIGSGTLASNVQAQVDRSMTTSIQFPFTVGTQAIPPGTYQFSLTSSPFLLSVLNVKTGHEQVFFVRPEKQRAFQSYGRLIFSGSEGCSALSQIHFPGTNTFSEIDQRHNAAKFAAKKCSADNSIDLAQR